MVKPAVTLSLAATDGTARAGTLTTPHGDVPTPTFMAVGTLGGLKGITVGQAESLGQGVLLSNTYHLALRPGEKVVHSLGGLHSFSGWKGPMLTDSGGYQVFSLASQRTIDEDGVSFRSHIDGRPLRLTPEESIRIQRFLGADIIMAFDECPPADAPKPTIAAAVDRTRRWLERSVHSWRNETENWPRGHAEQALFPIVQGGCHEDLRLASAQHCASMDCPGIAIGGLAVGESAEDRNRVLDMVCPHLPKDKPRYLMGVGTPIDLVDAVERGVDMFDCVLPTRMGRHGIAYTDDGPLHVKRAEWAEDPRPVDPDTPSEAKRVSRGYIRHLLKAGELLGSQLLAIHNLAYYARLMARMRTAIVEGTFSDWSASYRQRYSARASKPQ